MRQCMDADNLHRRLKKIVGQVQAIDRMVDEDVPCEDVLSQINAPSTIGNYYTSLVAHDMASGALSPKKPQYGDPDYYSFKPGESL